MNAKQMCIANVQYKKPTVDDAKRSKGLLRYLTYRDGRYGHIQQEAGMERWVDHGLGGSVRDIATRCDALKSEHVLAFTLVFNANPELMAMVPVAQRETFVKALTEASLERFFEARGIEGGIEMSYVLHHRESENAQSPGLHDPHTHVILPGTYFNEGSGEREALYFSRNKQVNHIELLHRTTEQTLRELLEREVGLDWEQRIDALEHVREQQRAIAESASHGRLPDEHGREWDAWIGERRTDEDHTAVGFYRHFPKVAKADAGKVFTPDELELEFRPLTPGLSHSQAALLARWATLVKTALPEQPLTEMLEFVRDVGAMEGQQRDAFLHEMEAELAGWRVPPPDQSRAIDPEPDQAPPARGYDLDFF